MVFQETLKGVYKKFQGYFKWVLRVFISREFQECFIEVSGEFQEFQECFKVLSMNIEGHFKVVF